MASPPDYDKEPKAPDKKANNIHHEDMKTTNDSTGDHLSESDSKSHNNVANTDVENKHVETLDDGQLRALLDEAITYKCPKDREGKSSLFKELLEEVEQDEQACEAAARELTGSRGRRAGKGRRALPHSNSLQDLVAALAAEPAARRRAAAALAAHAPPVSARALHGGSLPSGVDTSFLLSEEPTRGGYLATVRCVNPPPLSERRVSIDSSRSDNESRRSKPSSAGVTYTARATLEIGAACRALTTTSPSNQAKLMKALSAKNKVGGGHEARDLSSEPRDPHRGPRNAPPNKETLDPNKEHLTDIPTASNATLNEPKLKRNKKRELCLPIVSPQIEPTLKQTKNQKTKIFKKTNSDYNSEVTDSSIHNWYKSLADYSVLNKEIENCGGFQQPINLISKDRTKPIHNRVQPTHYSDNTNNKDIPEKNKLVRVSKDFSYTSKATEDYGDKIDPSQYNDDDWYSGITEYSQMLAKIQGADQMKQDLSVKKENTNTYSCKDKETTTLDLSLEIDNFFYCKKPNFAMRQPKQNKTQTENQILFQNDSTNEINKYSNDNSSDIRKKYRNHVGKLEAPNLSDFNPRNVKKMTIGGPIVQNIVSSPASGNTSTKNRQPAATTLVSSNEEVTNEYSGPNETNIQNKYKVIKNDAIEMKDMSKKINNSIKEIEMIDMPKVNKHNDFSEFCEHQQNLISALEESNSSFDTYDQNIDSNEKVQTEVKKTVQTDFVIEIADHNDKKCQQISEASPQEQISKKLDNNVESDKEIALYPNSTSLALGIVKKIETNYNNETETQLVEQATSLEVTTEIKTGEHYVLAELSNNAYIFLTLPKRLPTPNQDIATVHEIENNNVKPYAPGENINSKKKKVKQSISNDKTVINKDALREILLENLYKHSPAASSKAGLTSNKQSEVDSAIPFSCITTPEVVSSCNTTAASAPSATIVDPKPRAAAAAAATSVNGASPPADYKKSLDENGNSVQGYGTGLSGPGQLKKPRRKKTSKNEIVIKSHQIDGYQGNKDLNEVLRFIESHAARPKLRKHRDDADEKKSRGSRRKAVEAGGAPRAASLEEVSRTTLEELTSGGEPAADEPDAEFTTVTKRRARRRREPPPPALPVPDLISSCREYPALPPPPPPRAPDVLARPAVLLRPRRCPRDARLRGVTFGFELNETLLKPPHEPHEPHAPHALDALVAYVAHAWEDVIKCGNGKVRYYSE